MDRPPGEGRFFDHRTALERHVKALADFEPEYLEAYKSLSRLSAEVLAAEPGDITKQLDRIFGAAAVSKKK
jgi:hypothetical protein